MGAVLSLGSSTTEKEAEEKVRTKQPEGASLLLLALKREESSPEARRADWRSWQRHGKNSSLEPRWGTQACQYLGVGPMKAISNFWPLELWIVHLSCFKSLDLWSYVRAAKGNEHTSRSDWCL